MKIVSLLTLILVLSVACNSDEPAITDNKLVGTYISEGGVVGLASGDSLVITNQQISWLDGDIVWEDDEFKGFTYNKPWVTVSYTIVSDSALIIDSPLLWRGSDKNEYIYRLASDSIPSGCFLPQNALFLDADDCTRYEYECCSYHWNRQ